MNYRGIKPAYVVVVLEGNGNDVPYEEVQYVVAYEEIAGLSRQVTLGKITRLTEEEKKNFNRLRI